MTDRAMMTCTCGTLTDPTLCPVHLIMIHTTTYGAPPDLRDAEIARLQAALREWQDSEPEIARLQAALEAQATRMALLEREMLDQEAPSCEFCATRETTMRVCAPCWNGANNDTWQRKAVRLREGCQRAYEVLESLRLSVIWELEPSVLVAVTHAADDLRALLTPTEP